MAYTLRVCLLTNCVVVSITPRLLCPLVCAGYYCLVFETLGLSLLDLIKMNDYKRLPMDCVRDISRQLLEGMEFLSSINLIHTGMRVW